MRVVETVRVVNGDKTVLGKKEAELTFDTKTGLIDFNMPAMFGDPIIDLEDLKVAIANLEKVKDAG